MVSPWTSFEGFITLITAEKREAEQEKERTEEKKRKRRKEREKRERRKEEPRRIRPVSRPIKFFLLHPYFIFHVFSDVLNQDYV